MYVIAGVSGNTGRAAADALLAHKESVRVVLRDEKKSAEWRTKGAEVAVASLDDAAGLARAFAGARGAYLLVPPQYAAEDLIAAQRPVVDAIAQAVKASAIPHVVLLSSLGAQHAAGNGPIRTLHAAEQAIGKVAKSATFLRAAYFIENWGMVLGAARASGVLPTFLTLGRAIPMIATRDIGRAAADALLDPPQGARVVELVGPADWTPEDVARAVANLIGREVRAQGGPLDAVVPTLTSMGFQPGTAALFREMIDGINRGHVDRERGRGVLRLGTLTLGEVLGPILAAAS